MTDRVRVLTVLLDDDYRIDSIQEGVMQAIKMIKGVIHVEPIIVSGEDYFNREAARWELKKKVYEALED